MVHAFLQLKNVHQEQEDVKKECVLMVVVNILPKIVMIIIVVLPIFVEEESVSMNLWIVVIKMIVLKINARTEFVSMNLLFAMMATTVPMTLVEMECVFLLP